MLKDILGDMLIASINSEFISELLANRWLWTILTLLSWGTYLFFLTIPVILWGCIFVNLITVMVHLWGPHLKSKI